MENSLYNRVVHKVDIFVDFLMEINWKQLSQISFNANLQLSLHFELKLKWLISLSNIFPNLRSTKMPTLPTLCIMEKLECGS